MTIVFFSCLILFFRLSFLWYSFIEFISRWTIYWPTILIYFLQFCRIFRIYNGMQRKSKVKSWQIYIHKEQRDWRSCVLVMCPSCITQVQSTYFNCYRSKWLKGDRQKHGTQPWAVLIGQKIILTFICTFSQSNFALD